MKKRKVKSEVQRQYEKELKRIKQFIRRAEKRGYRFPDNVIPPKPKRITRASVSRLQKIKPQTLYKKATALSESGNCYPVGYPTFWKGNYIPEEALQNNRYYFVRIKTRFYIKEDKLPFIQMKGSVFYKGTEALESSDVVDRKTGEKSAFYVDFDGNIHDTRVELTLTCTDYIFLLFLRDFTTRIPDSYIFHIGFFVLCAKRSAYLFYTKR